MLMSKIWSKNISGLQKWIIIEGRHQNDLQRKATGPSLDHQHTHWLDDFRKFRWNITGFQTCPGHARALQRLANQKFLHSKIGISQKPEEHLEQNQTTWQSVENWWCYNYSIDMQTTLRTVPWPMILQHKSRRISGSAMPLNPASLWTDICQGRWITPRPAEPRSSGCTHDLSDLNQW